MNRMQAAFQYTRSRRGYESNAGSILKPFNQEEEEMHLFMVGQVAWRFQISFVDVSYIFPHICKERNEFDDL